MAERGTTLGKAYVQIMPSAEGIQQHLGEALGNAVEKPSKKAGERAGRSIGSLIKKAIVAAGIGAALKKVVSSAIGEGAALQQSIGGIETLFGAGGAKNVEEYADAVGKSVSEVSDTYEKLKASESKMLAYADSAWKTAGLSANAYMETSTSFAASLLSSLDGDTNAAAEAANRAVIAMSDNANKMGTDMSSIMQAYQGFAKGQYTLLDNLKLGYGGTKGEMERLLADASALSGQKYDIGNLADVYSAISVIQDKLGITGTTAKEAASTFSGSLAAMKAAGQNVLGKLTLGEDIRPALSGLGQSVKTFVVGNVAPMLKNVLSGLPQIVTEGLGMIGDVGNALLPALPGAIAGVAESIAAAAPSFIHNGAMLLDSLLTGFSNSLPRLLGSFTELIPKLIGSLDTHLPTLFTAAQTILQTLGTGIIKNLPVLLEKGLPLLLKFSETLLSNVSTFVDVGISVLVSVVRGVMQALPTLISMVPQIITNVCDIINVNMPKLLKAGVLILWEVVKGVIGAVPALIQNFGNIVKMIWSIIQAVNWLSLGSKIVTGLGNGIKAMFANAKAWGKDLIRQVIDSIKNGTGNILNIGKNLVRGLWDGIKNNLSWIKNRLKEWVGNVVDFIKNLFKIGSPSRLMEDEIGAMLPPGVANGVLENTAPIKRAMDAMAAEAGAYSADAWSAVTMSAPTLGGAAFTLSASDARSASQLSGIAGRLEKLTRIVEEGKNLYLDGRRWVGGTAGRMDDALGLRRAMDERGV